MNNTVQIEERTEVEGTFCPFANGKCRMNCKFMIDVEDGCMIENIYHDMKELLEDMEERAARENIDPEIAQYAE